MVRVSRFIPDPSKGKAWGASSAERITQTTRLVASIRAPQASQGYLMLSWYGYARASANSLGPCDETEAFRRGAGPRRLHPCPRGAALGHPGRLVGRSAPVSRGGPLWDTVQ